LDIETLNLSYQELLDMSEDTLKIGSEELADLEREITSKVNVIFQPCLSVTRVFVKMVSKNII
jgi:hypothetical protein